MSGTGVTMNPISDRALNGMGTNESATVTYTLPNRKLSQYLTVLRTFPYAELKGWKEAKGGKDIPYEQYDLTAQMVCEVFNCIHRSDSSLESKPVRC